MINEIFNKSNPLMWQLMPDMARSEIISVTRNQVPNAVRLVIRDIQKNIFKILDMRELAMESMSGTNVERMRALFKRVGGKEFNFLQRLGFYIGFILGVVQSAIWFVYPALWTVPILGAMVGGFTNWMALKMIFRPLEPKKCLFFTYQGLFLKRRAEVTREFANMVVAEVFNSKNIIKKTLEGKERDRISLIVRISISQVLDRLTTMVKPVIMSSLKSEMLDVVKHEVTVELTSPEATQNIEDYIDEALDLRNVMIEKFGLLTTAEFESVLRDIFKDDEWILIAVGTALGFLIGCIQAYYGFV